MKLNWRNYASRLKKTGQSRANVVRATNIPYPRVVGFFNGYWDLNEEELSKIETFLKGFEKSKAAPSATAKAS